MANRSQHSIGGALAGTGIYVFDRWSKQEPIVLTDLALCSLGGACVASLPDLLEPAYHPNHRQFFHSLSILGGLGLHLDTTLKNGRYTNPKKLAFKVFVGAYASHLILDGDTPKGLPLL